MTRLAWVFRLWTTWGKSIRKVQYIPSNLFMYQTFWKRTLGLLATDKLKLKPTEDVWKLHNFI